MVLARHTQKPETSDSNLANILCFWVLITSTEKGQWSRRIQCAYSALGKGALSEVLNEFPWVKECLQAVCM